jgi:signal transduction histidine kinase
MRIWLGIPDAALRRALSELLVVAGHEVSTAEVSAPTAQLHVVTSRRVLDAEAPSGHAVLILGADAASSSTDDPAVALTCAIERGGIATWPSPLDPARLVHALGVRSSTPLPVPDEGSAMSLLAASVDPWFLLDSDRRAVLWANAAARTRHSLNDATLSEALSQPPLADLAHTVFERATGTRGVEFAGHAMLAVWWTDTRRSRVLGLFEHPSGRRASLGGAEQALAEIGRVASTLAHEIRNPLSSLVGALDLLESESDPVVRAEVVDLARQRLTQMRILLDDTLRLARPFKEAATSIQPDLVIRSALSGVLTDALFREIDLRLESGGEPISALGHEEPLRQAVTNLLLNAAEAQDGHGSIKVRLTKEAGCAVIRVIDDGPGVPPDKRERVFDPFWTTKTTGTGLGLSYVRRVAEASGGRAFVEECNRGACFRLDLPLAR